MKEFVKVNKFPILKKIDQSYLTKMQREKRVAVIVALNRSDNNHISFLNNYLHYLAFENREKFIFTYLDFIEDKYFFDFFNIDLKIFSKSQNKNENNTDAVLKPIIIIYNFKINKFFIDADSFSENKNYLKISDKNQLKNLLEKIEKNEIKWSSGYLLEDIMTDIFGEDISREKLLMIYSGIFFTILAIILILIFSCCENKNKKKKD